MKDVVGRVGLAHLDVDGVVALNQAVREVAEEHTAMAAAAQAVAEVLRASLVDDDGRPACALARIYTTVRTGSIPAELRRFAERAHGGPLADGIPCLTLLGTAGDEPDWCDRRRSLGHQAIPLTDAAAVGRTPMVAGLLTQLGVDVETIVDLDPSDAIVLHHRDYGVFHVADAVGSPLIPAQDFVRSRGVRCVVGCGGALLSGELFATILFSREPIDDAAVPLFRTLAYGIKAALVPYTFAIFEP